jgi:hypothetical protein
VRPFRHPSSKHIDLLPQHQDFRFQLCLRLRSEAKMPTISLNTSVIRARA